MRRSQRLAGKHSHFVVCELCDQHGKPPARPKSPTHRKPSTKRPKLPAHKLSVQHAKPPTSHIVPNKPSIDPIYNTWIKKNSVNKVKNIEGPFGLTRMLFKGDDHCASKVFHLFHDVHVLTTTKCHDKPGTLQIVEFFDRLLTEPPYMIDFMLETYEYDENDLDGCYLTKLRNKFYQCFTRQTRLDGQCNVNLDRVRFHFNDVRLNWGPQRLELALNEWKKAMDENDSYIAEWTHDMYSMLGYSVDQWDTHLRKTLRVDKQLRQCSPQVRDIINVWMNEKLRDPEYVAPLHALKSWYANPTLENFEAVDPKRGFSMNLDLLIIYMDAYTVARAFRKFHQKKNEYSKDMRNIFLYTGGFHTKNYIELLGRLGCVKDGEVVNPRPKYMQCIPVEQFTPWKLVDTNTCE